MKHGHGVERFANGDLYEGDYINGKPDGKGEYRWSDGSYYKGEFCGGLRHGKGFWSKAGKSRFDNLTGNDCYEGDYVNDKKCGKGIFRWASGAVYEGDFFDDHRHGNGEM